jgi:glucan 1,3-beta-glucosidase
MRFTSIVTTLALSFIGLCQALPMIETRATAPALKNVTYSPFNPDGTCKTASQITSSIKQMKSVGIVNIRTYQQNCNQLATILNAIHSVGGSMTVLAGVRIDGSSNDQTEMNILKSVLNKKQNTQYIRGILVGNEVVFGKVMTSSALVQKIKAVKVFAKGYKVGTVEIYTTYTQDLMDASDIISVNLHPFFSQVDIKDAFSNLNAQYTNFKKLTKKPVYISETGWASAGQT